MTWTMKLALLVGIYLSGVLTPLMFRWGEAPEVVTVKTDIRSVISKKDDLKAVVTRKGEKRRVTTSKPDGTRLEEEIDEYEAVETVDRKSESKEDTSLTDRLKISPTKPLTRYSIGLDWRYPQFVSAVSGGVRLGNTPIFVTGYVDLLSISPDFRKVEVKYSGFGIGIRIEL